MGSIVCWGMSLAGILCLIAGFRRFWSFHFKNPREASSGTVGQVKETSRFFSEVRIDYVFKGQKVRKHLRLAPSAVKALGLAQGSQVAVWVNLADGTDCCLRGQEPNGKGLIFIGIAMVALSNAVLGI